MPNSLIDFRPKYNLAGGKNRKKMWSSKTIWPKNIVSQKLVGQKSFGLNFLATKKNWPQKTDWLIDWLLWTQMNFSNQCWKHCFCFEAVLVLFRVAGWIRIDHKAKSQFNCYCNCQLELTLAKFLKNLNKFFCIPKTDPKKFWSKNIFGWNLFGPQKNG